MLVAYYWPIRRIDREYLRLASPEVTVGGLGQHPQQARASITPGELSAAATSKG